MSDYILTHPSLVPETNEQAEFIWKQIIPDEQWNDFKIGYRVAVYAAGSPALALKCCLDAYQDMVNEGKWPPMKSNMLIREREEVEFPDGEFPNCKDSVLKEDEPTPTPGYRWTQADSDEFTYLNGNPYPSPDGFDDMDDLLG